MMDMKVDDDDGEEMKMIKLDGMSWIAVHKPFGYTVEEELLNGLCSELFKETKHFIFVDEINKAKIVDLSHLYSNEMKMNVIVYLLQMESGAYNFRFNDKTMEIPILKSLIAAECAEWAVSVDENTGALRMKRF